VILFTNDTNGKYFDECYSYISNNESFCYKISNLRALCYIQAVTSLIQLIREITLKGEYYYIKIGTILILILQCIISIVIFVDSKYVFMDGDIIKNSFGDFIPAIICSIILSCIIIIWLFVRIINGIRYYRMKTGISYTDMEAGYPVSNLIISNIV